MQSSIQMRTYTLLPQRVPFGYTSAMAIFHCVIKTLQRSEGKRAVAAAAYRRAVSMRDYQEEVKYNYEYKRGVIYSEILVPLNAPMWAKALSTSDKENGRRFSEKLWNAAEAVEKRKDAQLAREIEFALPIELSQAQNIALAREYLNDQFASRGMIVDWSVHWDLGNPHVHALLTLRELTSEGFGQKVRAWNDRALAVEWRSKLSEYINFHLKLNGHAVTVDHRSYQAQGIELIPTQHQGKAVRDMERRGMKTEIGRQSRDIQNANLSRLREKPQVLFDKLTKERETFTYQDVGHELGKYVNDRQAFFYEDSSAASLSARPGSAFAGAQSLLNSTQTGNASLAASSSLPPGLLADRLLQDIKGRPECESSSLEALGEKRCLTPAVIAQILQEMEQHESVFKEHDLAKALLPFTCHAQAFAQALYEIKASDQLIALGLGEDGRQRWTTKRLFALENKLEGLARQLSERRHRPIEKLRTADFLAAYESETGKILTAEQREAVKHLIGQKALSCLAGRAGTGKSVTLGAARFLWEAAGLKVQGTALSGVAARNLSAASGIASRTIESLRYALEAGKLVLRAQDVVVMDEAGMTDSPALLSVLSAVEKGKAKLVLVGDPQQLQPVGPGAAFRAVAAQVGFAELQEIYRQKTDWQREATVLLAKGQTESAIELYRRHLCVHLAPDRVSAMVMLLKDWRQRWERLPSKTLSSLLVLTHRHEDVQQINQFIRAVLTDEGTLSEGAEVQTSYQTISIAQGERLLMLQNNAFLGVKNGDFGTVSWLERTEGGRLLRFGLTLDQGGQEIVIDPSQYGHFDYGYSATVHKAQGLTVDHAFVYAGSHGWDRHLSYVAMSRHRLSCRLYASCETYKDMSALKKGLSRLSIKDSVIDYPIAFGKRRGISLFKALEMAVGKHLAGRLKALSVQFASTMEEALSPSRYWAKKTAQAKALQTQAETAKRRSDAVQVAIYAEANRACGAAFEVYAQKAKSLGIDLNDKRLSPEIYQLLAKLPETRSLRKALMRRNALARPLLKALGRYTQALAHYQIKTSALFKQSASYQFWTRLKRYHKFKKAHKTVLRDRCAFRLCRSLKAHYHFVKLADVDIKALRQHAQAHARKLLLKDLDAHAREDFKRVEAYRDTCQAMQSLLSGRSQTSAGTIEKAASIDRKPAVFASLSDDRRAQLQGLSLQRNAQAAEIYTQADRFKAALDFYDYGQAKPPLGFDKVSDQAQRTAHQRWYKLVNSAAQHGLTEKARLWQSAARKLKQKLAWEMLEDRQGYPHYYPALLESAQPIKDVWQAIRKDAKQHERRLCLKRLDVQGKADFRRLESYRAACSAVRLLMQRLKEETDRPALSAKTQGQLRTLTLRRNALAALLYAQPARFKAGFDFYGYGPSLLSAGADKHQADAARYAQDRQQKLAGHAAQHAQLIRIEAYRTAASLPLKQRLAFELLQEPESRKTYARTLLQLGLAAKDFWAAVRQAAGAYERALFLKTAPKSAQEAFAFLDYYLEKKQALSQSWQTYFAQKAEGMAAERPSSPAQAEYQSWSAALLEDREIFEQYFALFQIEPAHLEKDAQKHDCRQTVKAYQRAQGLEKSRLAQTIAAAPKAYAFAVKEAGLSWQTLSQAACRAERRALFKTLTLEEKGFLRRAWRYQQYKRLAGKAYGRLTAQRSGGLPQEKISLLQAKTDRLMCCRDSLAYRVKEKRTALERGMLGETERSAGLQRLDAAAKLDETKLAAHAQRHRLKLDIVRCWQDDKRYVQQALEKSLSCPEAEKAYREADLLKALNAMAQDEAYARLSQQTASFSAALREAGEPSDSLVRWKAVCTWIEKRGQTQRQDLQEKRRALLAAEQQERRQKAQRIAQGTRPIEGTLAERYLREHRGIRGKLPDSLRYHPAHYNHLAGQKTPALAVLARNAQGEIQAVQVISLDPHTAQKAFGKQSKLTFGVLLEAGVLMNEGRAEKPVIIAEGPETALSVAQAMPDHRVYAALGAGNFGRLPLGENVRQVIFAADNDGKDAASLKLLQKAAYCLSQQDKDVFIAMPEKIKTDFNDLLKTQCSEAVRLRLDQAQLFVKGQAYDKHRPLLKEAIQTLTDLKILPKKDDWQKILFESVELTGTLGEKYLLNLGLDVKDYPHLAFHPKVWEKDSQRYLPAVIVKAFKIQNGKSLEKGIQINYLDENTAGRAAVKAPIRYWGEDKATLSLLQQNDKNPNRLILALDLETALVIADSRPESTVLMLPCVGGVDKWDFKGKDKSLTLCAHPHFPKAILKKIIAKLHARRFKLALAIPDNDQSWPEVLKTKGKAVIAESIKEAVPLYTPSVRKVIQALEQFEKKILNARRLPQRLKKLRTNRLDYMHNVAQNKKLLSKLRYQAPHVLQYMVNLLEAKQQKKIDKEKSGERKR